MKNVTILLAVVAMLGLAAPAFAQTHQWDGGGDGIDWHDANNWDVDTVPSGSSDWCVIQSYGTIANPLLVKDGNTADLDKICLGAWGSHYAHLKLEANGTIRTDYEFRIGYDNDGTALSTFAQVGGDVISGTSSSQDYGYTGVGYGAWGRYTISGGTLSTSESLLSLGASSGKGEFIVDCSGAAGSGPTSITTKGYDQSSTSSLEFKLDAAGNALAITVDGDVTLAGTLNLTGTRTSTDPLVLMTYTGSLSTTFDTEPAGWTMSYTGGQVTATIPEPATMVLLGIGGIGVLIRRKRR